MDAVRQARDGDGRPPPLGVLQEPDLDVAGVVGRGHERPGHAAVVPVARVQVPDGDAVLDEAVERGGGEVEVVGVVAAPGVGVAAAVGDEHREGRAVVRVADPGAVAAERLAGGAVVDAGAVVADRHPHPPAAVAPVVPQPDLVGQLRRERPRVEGVVPGRVVDVEGDEVLRLERRLGQAAPAVGRAEPVEVGGVARHRGCLLREGAGGQGRQQQPGAGAQHGEQRPQVHRSHRGPFRAPGSAARPRGGRCGSALTRA